ncbi:protein S-acyltransferase [Malassezia yamatoensis]|uniref:Palmitoyltransferase n=1 Tax=Malassezia yamatoensis TaxID=253288 RepID=A0AAJ5YSE6_9BASI|nr:protein S-acyltransferase [Malassezia yamatoensis]
MSLEPECSVHQAAQRGDYEQIRQILQAEPRRVNDRDEQNVTALHWAAINGYTDCCELLLENGADVDAAGGELEATALHWSARNGQLNSMHLLVKYGANLKAVDKQGFNALHLTTHSSYIMPLIFVLQQDEYRMKDAIDSKDPQGHTSLMWAAFQGDAMSVQILLKHGANVHTVDEAGLTPLHWAVVAGSRLCMERIIAQGAQLTAKDNTEKTAADLAREVTTYSNYVAALNALGRDRDGRSMKQKLGLESQRILIYLVPFLGYGALFQLVPRLPWFFAGPSFILGVAMIHLGIGLFVVDRNKRNALKQSPYYLSLLAMSLAWLFLMWFNHVLPATPMYWKSNMLVGVLLLTVIANLWWCASTSPGRCPEPKSFEERQSDVNELASHGMLTGLSFCITCLARRPLRSKHCHMCGVCIPRHDHHCPWIDNCVGLRNHRPFIVMLIAAEIGIPLYLSLVYQYYLDQIPDNLVARYRDHFFSAWITAAVQFNGALFCSSVWIFVINLWLLILLGMQLAQIARQLTTFEASNVGRYGFMGGRGDTNMTTQNGFIEQQAERMIQAGVPRDQVQKHLYGCSSHKKKSLSELCLGIGSSLMSIVGLDLYTRGKGGQGLSRSRAAANPFDRGWMKNCLAGDYLGVDYERLYDVPT